MASSERPLQCMCRLAAHGFDAHCLQRCAVERTPGKQLFITRADPFFAKSFLAADKELQILAHAFTIPRDKSRQPAIMVAVTVAQDEPVEPLRLDPEKAEISHQNLGRVTEIEKVLV